MVYNILLFVLSLSHMSVHIVMMLIPSMFIDLSNFYNLSASSLGLIFSISSFCFGFGSLPMAFLYNKYGPRTLLVFSQIGVFISALLASNSTNVESFAIFNIFLGLFASIHHPVSLTLIAEVFDKNIAKANAFHGIFGSLGVSTGPLICYYAITNFDWQFSFFLIGIFNLIIAPMTFFVIPKAKKRDSANIVDFKMGNQLRILQIFCLISLVIGIVFTIFNTFIPSVFQVSFGEQSNLLVSGILIFGIFGQILSGFFGDKFNRIKLLSFVLMILCPLFIATYFLSNFSLIAISMLLAIFMYAIQPLVNSIIKDITTAKIRSVIFGLNFFLMFGVSGLVAAIGGLIADLYSFELIFPIFSVLFPLGIFLLYLLYKNTEMIEG